LKRPLSKPFTPYYRGRFAPSPSGPLHYGSLVTAVASYLQARCNQGLWQLRIEDIDPPREQKGAVRHILSSLRAFGFDWDGAVLYQSHRLAYYRHIAEQLHKHHLAFYCECSRKQLISSPETRLGRLYEGRCRKLDLLPLTGRTLRMRVGEERIEFNDGVFGAQSYDLLAESGDYVVYRGDQLPSYTLAVSLDDLQQGYTELVRGADLLHLSARQLHLMQQFNRQPPQLLHIPIITDANGQKLSKQHYAAALDTRHRSFLLYCALKDLGQEPPKYLCYRSIARIWDWAYSHWQASLIAPEMSIKQGF
jgi:glutamyl-Q tRNA(Asp) synthetase